MSRFAIQLVGMATSKPGYWPWLNWRWYLAKNSLLSLRLSEYFRSTPVWAEKSFFDFLSM